MTQFSDMLKALRKDRRITQGDLAEALGVSRSTISMYECGEREPDFASLRKIADFFHTDINLLLGYPVSDDGPAATLTCEQLTRLLIQAGPRLSLQQKQDLIRALLMEDHG